MFGCLSREPQQTSKEPSNAEPSDMEVQEVAVVTAAVTDPGAALDRWFTKIFKMSETLLRKSFPVRPPDVQQDRTASSPEEKDEAPGENKDPSKDETEDWPGNFTR